MDDDKPRFFTVKEVADVMRRSPRTVYRWIDEGFMVTIKVKDGHLVTQSEVDRILALNLPEEQ